jgi:hypothetical protein
LSSLLEQFQQKIDIRKVNLEYHPEVFEIIKLPEEGKINIPYKCNIYKEKQSKINIKKKIIIILLMYRKKNKNATDEKKMRRTK